MDSFETRSTAELDQARRHLGRLPMVVLTAGRSFDTARESGARHQAALKAMHCEITALSGRAVQRTIDCGNMIPLERPEAVIAAVNDVLGMID